MVSLMGVMLDGELGKGGCRSGFKFSSRCFFLRSELGNKNANNGEDEADELKGEEGFFEPEGG